VAARGYGQDSGLATAVERVGERWALLVVRDLLVGPRRYTDLRRGLPRIPTNILAARLKELQEAGVVRRVPLMNCGLVYELTPYGRALEPVVLALERWGLEAPGAPQPEGGDAVSADALTMTLRSLFRPEVAASVPDADYELHLDPVVLRVRVEGDALRIAQLAPSAVPVGGRMPEGEPDVALALASVAALRGLASGALTPADALDEGVARILRGEGTLIERFAATFRLAPGQASRPSGER